MHYPGEHLLPGQLGHFFIVLSLVASLTATFAYFKASTIKNELDAGYWKKLARYSFLIETAAVFTVFGILVYILTSHLFEYRYAWKQSSRSLEFKYIFAAIWGDQEGSFLLWSIWHCVLGLVVIKTGKKWEAPVMTVVNFVQICLATMICGFYVFGQKIGSNPFTLLRDAGILDNAPQLHINLDVNLPLKTDYLKSITDGNDLNVLLQNYWMVIHPPVLFLGFASTVVPFAYVVAGLWKKKFSECLSPALPWALFSAAVLGIGIMMGAAWAYESLNFGGYWAWDPVENASLVPWMVMVAGIHTLLIYKHTGYSLRSTHIFFILSFWLVVYSTFLTRSGILGDTSVHAFTESGLNIQLYLFMYLLVWLPGIFFAKDRQVKLGGIILSALLLPAMMLYSAPWLGLLALLGGIAYTMLQLFAQVEEKRKEENTSSREFWMYIASLVLFLSAVVIIAKTSVPIANKVFNIKLAPAEDQEYAYNQIQVFVAIILMVLTAISQYLKYKNTPSSYLVKKIGIPTVAAVLIATLVLISGHINYAKKGYGFMAAIWVATACSIYAIVANAAYIWVGLKGKLRLSGGSVAHAGFAMVLLGILISSSKKEIISTNSNGLMAPLSEKENPAENITLVKGSPARMGKYDVTYERETIRPEKKQSFFRIRFQERNGKENFVLTPNAFINYKMQGIQPNPDTKHFLDHDVLVYITSLPDPEKNNDSVSTSVRFVKQGDTVFYSGGYFVLQTIKKQTDVPKELFGDSGMLYEVPVKIYSKTGSIFSLTPKLAIAKGQPVAIADTVLQENLVLQLEDVDNTNTVKFLVKETKAPLQYITLKAYKFPYINILWLGVLITAAGITISMVHRIQQNRIKKADTGT